MFSFIVVAPNRPPWPKSLPPRSFGEGRIMTTADGECAGGEWRSNHGVAYSCKRVQFLVFL